jgi:hypothetical protein
MEATARRVGVGMLAMACTLVILSFLGCQSSDRMAVSPTNPMCPACGQAAQAQQLADLNFTQVICPVCADAEKVDPRFLERLEVFTGGPLGDTVYACSACSALIAQCAACPPAGGAVARRNNRGG